MTASGEAYWALVPYAPEAPFRIYAKGRNPVEVPDIVKIVDGLRKGGDAEFGFIVPGKARPILLLSDRVDPSTGDMFGLRLLRLSSLAEDEQQAVRGQTEETLFHLRPERFPELGEESAAVISAPIRLHQTALDTRRALGALDTNEQRVLVERFIAYWRFDLTQLISDRIRTAARARSTRRHP